jgi:hypothetical protein
MVRKGFALEMRCLSAGAVVALAALLVGCVVETTDTIQELELDEDVAEAESQLDETGSVAPGEAKKDPDPNPWHFHTESTDPNPDPNSLMEQLPAHGSNHDE